MNQSGVGTKHLGLMQVLTGPEIPGDLCKLEQIGKYKFVTLDRCHLPGHNNVLADSSG